MLAIHDRYTEEMRNRLETICMGLGLVRLLQHARRFDEARMTLSLLEYGCEREARPSDNPNQQRKRAKRVKGDVRAAATKNDTAEIPPQTLSLA